MMDCLAGCASGALIGGEEQDNPPGDGMWCLDAWEAGRTPNSMSVILVHLNL